MVPHPGEADECGWCHRYLPRPPSGSCSDPGAGCLSPGREVGDQTIRHGDASIIRPRGLGEQFQGRQSLATFGFGHRFSDHGVGGSRPGQGHQIPTGLLPPHIDQRRQGRQEAIFR